MHASHVFLLSGCSQNTRLLPAKNIDFGSVIGSGVFSEYNIFAQWGQVLIPLFPVQHARTHWKHTARQHKHTLILYFPQNTHGKGTLDHHGTVKLPIKGLTNDVSSPLFKGWGNFDVHTLTAWYLITSSTNTKTPKMLKYYGCTRYTAQTKTVMEEKRGERERKNNSTLTLQSPPLSLENPSH